MSAELLRSALITDIARVFCTKIFMLDPYCRFATITHVIVANITIPTIKATARLALKPASTYRIKALSFSCMLLFALAEIAYVNAPQFAYV
jgi:hypothetical protein